jgi:hypothetical protein
MYLQELYAYYCSDLGNSHKYHVFFGRLGCELLMDLFFSLGSLLITTSSQRKSYSKDNSFKGTGEWIKEFIHVSNDWYKPVLFIHVACFYISENQKEKAFLVCVFQTIILYLVKNLTYGNAYHIHKGFDQ